MYFADRGCVRTSSSLNATCIAVRNATGGEGRESRPIGRKCDVAQLQIKEERLRQQLDGVEWFVTYALLGATRHKSSQVSYA